MMLSLHLERYLVAGILELKLEVKISLFAKLLSFLYHFYRSRFMWSMNSQNAYTEWADQDKKCIWYILKILKKKFYECLLIIIF